MSIKVTIKSVYGRETIYPAFRLSETFAKMLNQSSLTRCNIKHIKELGYEIEIVHPTAIM